MTSKHDDSMQGTALKAFTEGFRSAPRTTDQIAAWLRERILTEVFPPKTKIPPERELAEGLGVSRHTLRSALVRLEAEGLITTRQGSGTLIDDYREVGKLMLVVHFPQKRQEEILKGLLEMRRAVAVEAVSLACDRATEQSLEALEATAHQIQQEDDYRALREMDILFTRLLFRAADNLPMELLFNTLLPAYVKHEAFARALFEGNAESKMGYLVIVGLIRQGEPSDARSLLLENMKQRDETILHRFRKYNSRGD